jgi:hypothetical protein
VGDQAAVGPVADLALGEARQLGELAAAQRIAVSDLAARIEDQRLLESRQPRPQRSHPRIAQELGISETAPPLR